MELTVQSVIKSIFKRTNKKHQTLEQRLYCAAHPLVQTSWHGVPMVVSLRELSAAQIHDIGDVTMVQTFYDRIAAKQEPTVEQMNAYAERHHEILKLAMAVPTYDEMMKIAGSHVDQDKIDQQLNEIKELFKKTPSGPEKAVLKKRYEVVELASRFLLPADFTAPLVAWVMGVSRSDIQKVTSEILIKCAFLAEKGHDNPADHFGGILTRFEGDNLLIDDFNNRAWIELHKHRENKGAVKKLNI